MGRGRPKKHDTPVSWYVSIPSSLAAEVELILLDPLTGRPRFGERSQLVELLLRDWVEKMRLTSGAPHAIILEPNDKSHADRSPGTTADSIRPNDGGGISGPTSPGFGEGSGNG